jgi:hypothetical protein
MRLLLVAVILQLALGFIPLSARVGETLDQCKVRYGKETAIATVYDFGAEARDLAYYNFEKNGIAIQIGFLNGKAVDLSFHHAGPSVGLGVPAAALTQVEIDTLLAANSAGMQWKTVADGKLTFFPDTPSEKSRYGPYQQRDDGVMATVDGNTLHIFTPEWLTYINDQMKIHDELVKEDQKANLDGF